MELAKELITAVQRNNSHAGYGLQKECEALVSHVLSNMVKTKMPPLDSDAKNEEDSARFREEGNQSFVSGDDDEAIEKYTMSLAYAPSRGSMALALANRSAALYRKKLYRECLIDIDAALVHGYPPDKQRKLKDRAQKAVEAVRQLYRPKDLNMNDLPATGDPNQEPIEGDLAMIRKFIDDRAAPEACATDDLDELMSKGRKGPARYIVEERELSFAHGPSEEAPALSKGVRIAYSQKYGRYLEATEEFQPGDIVAMEKPYAYVVYREKYYTHCHHCLERSYNLIPCPACPVAQYCSEKCKTRDWELAHGTECPILAVLSKLLKLDKDKIRILTKIIRLLIIATKNGTAIDEVRRDAEIAEKNPDNRTAGFTDDGKFLGHETRCALSLSTNLDTRPLMEVSAFACISALAAVLLAVVTKFFGKKYEMDELREAVEKDDVKFCGTLIFRNCVIVSSNSYSVGMV
ncbi:SET and MYND domain-containing protein 4-like [Copidosoma floridanum]|uniref:SET and MYND domain-containing protein 4-like n=1 Tax=Copidosoma floridanum TaxID=29053 RepID=UPI0006C960DA|nr:SET and MYND domain-containing protein 4-like [Copidosoma floridanum]